MADVKIDCCPAQGSDQIYLVESGNGVQTFDTNSEKYLFESFRLRPVKNLTVTEATAGNRQRGIKQAKQDVVTLTGTASLRLSRADLDAWGPRIIGGTKNGTTKYIVPDGSIPHFSVHHNTGATIFEYYDVQVAAARLTGRTGETLLLEMDLTAALQLSSVASEYVEKEGDYWGIFELGFCVGRLFSSVQNMATLEGKAHKADHYKASYKERGRKSRSSERRKARVERLLLYLETLVAANNAMARLKPIRVAETAIQDAAQERPDLWKQGKGQLEGYLGERASNDEYRPRFDAMFFKSS